MSQMQRYNKPAEKFEKIEQMQEEVDDLKEIMVKNIGMCSIFCTPFFGLFSTC